MPLIFPIEPNDGQQLVNEHLDAFERNRRPIKPRRGSPEPAKPNLGPARPTIKSTSDTYAPHPVYTLNIMDLVSGGVGLAAARQWGFYYVLENDKGHASARSHVLTDELGSLSVASLSFGTYSRDTVSVLLKLAMHDQVSVHDYEVRSLRCKHIFFAAIWLKALDGTSDLIHPLENSYYVLQGEPPYLADDFLVALRPLAERFLKKYQAFGARLRINDDQSTFVP